MLVALRAPAKLENRRYDARAEYSFLERRFTTHTVFMEVGGADCALALRAASYVERVYAIDVSGQFVQRVLVPINLRLVLCDGVRIPVPAAVVDVAWTGAFMDQLHPDDARQHLASAHRSLVEGGEYVCTTAGSSAEVRRRLLAAGFSSVRFYAASARVPGTLSALIPHNLLRISAIK